MTDEKRLLKTAVIAAWITLTVFLAFVLGLSAPWEKLLGHGSFASVATTHGIFATLGVIIGSATGSASIAAY